MKKVTIVGAGTMGAGIAQVFAGAYGEDRTPLFEVTLVDVDRRILEKAKKRIAGSLKGLARRGLFEGDPEEVAGRISLCESAEEGSADASLAVEAVFEDLEVKSSVLKALDSGLPHNALLATNTSSISITRLAGETSRPDRFIGMHFMNPAPVMKLVEVIRGEATSDETHRRMTEITESLGKTPITVKDSPGFVVNRLLMPLINEASRLLESGVASASDIDTAMTLGTNFPVGPLALGDVIGLDVVLAIMKTLHEETKEEGYRPSGLLEKMVAEGRLGRKSGNGFIQRRKGSQA